MQPGDSAIDLGCGPIGILDLLSAAVAPGGRAVGVDANPGHVEIVQDYAREHVLTNVGVIAADARRTGLESCSFDPVHARTLLVTVPKPGEVLAEMVRLARPGGWVASQEADIDFARCYPALPAQDRLVSLFRTSFGRSGANPHAWTPPRPPSTTGRQV